MILKMKILGAAKNCSAFPFRWGKAYFGSTLYPPPQNSLRLHTPLGRLGLLLHKSSKVWPLEKNSKGKTLDLFSQTSLKRLNGVWGRKLFCGRE